jgi:hypothetical protein
MIKHDCIRHRVEIMGENYYLTVGDDFVDVTVPRENYPEQQRERAVANMLGRKITAMMRMRRILKSRKTGGEEE